jgi:hypothetical protein
VVADTVNSWARLVYLLCLQRMKPYSFYRIWGSHSGGYGKTTKCDIVSKSENYNSFVNKSLFISTSSNWCIFLYLFAVIIELFPQLREPLKYFTFYRAPRCWQSFLRAFSSQFLPSPGLKLDASSYKLVTRRLKKFENLRWYEWEQTKLSQLFL